MCVMDYVLRLKFKYDMLFKKFWNTVYNLIEFYIRNLPNFFFLTKLSCMIFFRF